MPYDLTEYNGGLTKLLLKLGHQRVIQHVVTYACQQVLLLFPNGMWQWSSWSMNKSTNMNPQETAYISKTKQSESNSWPQYTNICISIHDTSMWCISIE